MEWVDQTGQLLDYRHSEACIVLCFRKLDDHGDRATAASTPTGSAASTPTAAAFATAFAFATATAATGRRHKFPDSCERLLDYRPLAGGHHSADRPLHGFLY